MKLGLMEKAASIALTSGSGVSVRAVEAEALRQSNEPVIAACAVFLKSRS